MLLEKIFWIKAKVKVLDEIYNDSSGLPAKLISWSASQLSWSLIYENVIPREIRRKFLMKIFTAERPIQRIYYSEATASLFFSLKNFSRVIFFYLKAFCFSFELRRCAFSGRLSLCESTNTLHCNPVTKHIAPVSFANG